MEPFCDGMRGKRVPLKISKKQAVVAAVVLSSLILMADLFIGSDVLIPLGYLLPIALLRRSRDPVRLLAGAGILSVLVLLGLFGSEWPADVLPAVMNRLLVIAAIWLTARSNIAFVQEVEAMDARRQSAEKLQQQEQLLRMIMESTAEGIYGLDTQGNCTFCNTACVRILGFSSADELLGQNMHHLIHHHRTDGSEYPEEECSIYRAIRRQERVHVDDEVLYRKDGSSFPSEYWSYPIVRDGQLAGAVVSFVDITERLQQRAVANRLAAIIEHTQDAVISADLTGIVTSWNPGAERIYGYTADQMLGQSISRLFSPEQMGELQTLMQRLREGQAIEHHQTTRRHADGHQVDVSISITALRNSRGEITGAATISRDISKQKTAEERIRKVIESAPNGFVMIDRSGTISLVNSATESQFGYSRDEMIGQPVEMLLPERFRAEHPEKRTAFFETPTTRLMGGERELTGRRKDGTEFPLEIGLNPLRTDEGLFVLASVVDISDRLEAEAKQRAFHQELQERNREMEQFVYTISHDLKSPLVTMQGFIGMMAEDLAAGAYDDVSDAMQRVQRAGNHMSRLLTDLLQLSRVGTIRNEPEWVDVGAMLREIQEEMATRLAEVGTDLKIADNLPPAFADRVRLRQIFENLLSNAVKYGSDADQPCITVDGRTSGEMLEYSVADNGPGIPEEFHRKVFGVFQRLASDDEGTGLGLAVVRRIAKVHGGDVRLESEAGQGARFIVSLPASEAATAYAVGPFRLEVETEAS